MARRLNCIANWDELAEKSGYSVKEFAHLCKKSPRQLERDFWEMKNQTPHHWLNELRQAKGLQLVAARRSVKEAAEQLRYRHATHFSRAFRRHYGVSPSEI